MIKIIAQEASESKGRGRNESTTQNWLASLLLEGYAHTVRIDRSELFRPPRLGLKRTVGMHFAASFLVFGVDGFNTRYDEPHHGLVSNFSGQSLVGHSRDVQGGPAAVDTDVVWWRAVTKSFLKAAGLGPPIQRLHCIGGRQNGDRSFNDGVHYGNHTLDLCLPRGGNNRVEEVDAPFIACEVGIARGTVVVETDG